MVARSKKYTKRTLKRQQQRKSIRKQRKQSKRSSKRFSRRNVKGGGTVKDEKIITLDELQSNGIGLIPLPVDAETVNNNEKNQKDFRYLYIEGEKEYVYLGLPRFEINRSDSDKVYIESSWVNDGRSVQYKDDNKFIPLNRDNYCKVEKILNKYIDVEKCINPEVNTSLD